MRHLTETTCRQSREMTSVLAFLLIGITLAWGTASPTVAQEQSAAFDYDDIGLRVALWLDKEEGEIYRKGSNIEVGFQTNEDAYAVVYRVDTEGLVTVLWPRSRLDDGFVFTIGEPAQGTTNLNGDTDATEDTVWQVYREAAGVTNL